MRAVSSLFLLLLISGGMVAQPSSPVLVSPQQADTWAATDDRGRSVPLHGETRDLRRDKYVGVFYFLWLGAHGYDAHTTPLADEGVMPKRDTAYRRYHTLLRPRRHRSQRPLPVPLPPTRKITDP